MCKKYHEIYLTRQSCYVMNMEVAMQVALAQFGLHKQGLIHLFFLFTSSLRFELKSKALPKGWNIGLAQTQTTIGPQLCYVLLGLMFFSLKWLLLLLFGSSFLSHAHRILGSGTLLLTGMVFYPTNTLFFTGSPDPPGGLMKSPTPPHGLSMEKRRVRTSMLFWEGTMQSEVRRYSGVVQCCTCSDWPFWFLLLGGCFAPVGKNVTRQQAFDSCQTGDWVRE